MPTLTFEASGDVDFEVYCSCGNGLCNQTDVDDRRKKIYIEPCQKCLEDARQKGYDEGYEDGLKEEK